MLSHYPELVRIGEEVKALGLDPLAAVDETLARVVAWAQANYGPVPPREEPTISEVVRVLLGIEPTVVKAFDSIDASIRRIADVLDPPPPELVESGYVARKLGCTTTWVADMARHGEIPRSCIVPGTGNGKPWKFCRIRIDEWIARR